MPTPPAPIVAAVAAAPVPALPPPGSLDPARDRFASLVGLAGKAAASQGAEIPGQPSAAALPRPDAGQAAQVPIDGVATPKPGPVGDVTSRVAPRSKTPKAQALAPLTQAVPGALPQTALSFTALPGPVRPAQDRAENPAAEPQATPAGARVDASNVTVPRASLLVSRETPADASSAQAAGPDEKGPAHHDPAVVEGALQAAWSPPALAAAPDAAAAAGSALAGVLGAAPPPQESAAWRQAGPDAASAASLPRTAADAAADAPAGSPAAQIGGAFASLHVGPGDAGHVTIRLDPPELGGVQVRIARDHQGGATVSVAVERPETLTRLQADLPHLHQALDRAGVPEQQRGLTLHLAPAAAGGSGQGEGFGAGTQGQRGFQQQTPQGFGAGGRAVSQDAPGAEGAWQQSAQAAARWLRAGVDITA